MKKYTYVPGSFIAAWLIWELIVRLGGFNEALLPTPYKVLIGFGELIGDGVLFKDIADSLVRFFIGYLISVVAGVFFGLILGWYKGFGTTSIQSFRSFVTDFSCGVVAVYRSRSSVSARRRLSLSSLSRRSSRCYCPRCPLFRILTLYTSRWHATLVLSSQNCYLKSYYLPYSWYCIRSSHRPGTAWIFLVTGEMVGPKRALASSHYRYAE